MAEKIHALAGILAKQVQILENATTDVQISRLLPWAAGPQLDALGDIVGAARNSLDDEVYRAAIQLQIYKNNSSGTPVEVAAIAKAITGASSVRYVEVPPGAYRLYLTGGSLPDGILEIMQSLSPGGVRILGVHLNALTPFRVGMRVGRRLLDE